MGITLKDQTERLSWISGTLSTWRRWSRQFLPPDHDSIKGGAPRGLSLNESFELMLAGHLVGELKFSTPDAKKIIEDLKPWMMENGYYPDCTGFELKGIAQKVKFHEIIMARSPLIAENSYGYKMIGHIGRTYEPHDRENGGASVWHQTLSVEKLNWNFGTRTTTLQVFSLLSNFLIRMEGLYDRDEIRNFIQAKGFITKTELEADNGYGEEQQEGYPSLQ